MNKTPIVDLEKAEVGIHTKRGIIRYSRYFNPGCNPSGERYSIAGNAAIQAGFLVPTGEYFAPFVHSMYSGHHELQDPSQMFRVIATKGYFWVYNANLLTPEGLFSVKDRNAKGLINKLNINDLKLALTGGSRHPRSGVEMSADGEVAFAPKGSFDFGMVSVRDPESNGYLVANYGSEGANLLAEASQKSGMSINSMLGEIPDSLEVIQGLPVFAENNGSLIFGDFWPDSSGYLLPVRQF